KNRFRRTDRKERIGVTGHSVCCYVASLFALRSFLTILSHPLSQTRYEGIAMNRTTHGVIHGRTIELAEDPGITEGQEVEITIRLIPPARRWGDGLRRCAGALAGEWTADDDRILEEIHREREQDTRRDLPE
ncbi:MAG: hypothetical protein ACYC61_26145, partial [Isosphaeraceae bacterium]